MRVSHLIERLKGLTEEYGEDLPVTTCDEEGVVCWVGNAVLVGDPENRDRPNRIELLVMSRESMMNPVNKPGGLQ